jgi:hypothetical protein
MEITLVYPTISLVYSPTKTVTITVSEITDYIYDGWFYHFTYFNSNTIYQISVAYTSITTFNGRTAVPSDGDLDIIFHDFIYHATNPPAPAIPTPVNIQDETTTVIAEVVDGKLSVSDSAMATALEAQTSTEGNTVSQNVTDVNAEGLLNKILKELKIMNIQFSIMTDNEIKISEVQ